MEANEKLPHLSNTATILSFVFFFLYRSWFDGGWGSLVF